jgi:hypothetical protein
LRGNTALQNSWVVALQIISACGERPAGWLFVSGGAPEAVFEAAGWFVARTL